MRILVTGFDPFGGEGINPAWEAVSLLPDRIGEHSIAKLLVPTAFGQCEAPVLRALKDEGAQAVLSVGQAGGRPDVAVERVALNLADARIPDNQGRQPTDEAIHAEGPAAYFSTLPTKAMVEAIKAAGLPASLSYSAGTFVCNYLLYSVLHYAATQMPQVQAGFIHVPFLPAQVLGKPGTPSMSLESMAAALEAALGALGQ